MRHYRREHVDAPKVVEKVNSSAGVSNLLLECPKCCARMRWCDYSPDERYMPDGMFESTEVYKCECGTEVRVTQVYAPVGRKVSAERTVWLD